MAVPLIDVDDAPLLARPFFAATGETSPIVRLLAHVPELVPAMLPFVGAALGAGATGLRAKEIVILRVSHLNDCRYCVGAHTVAARDCGLDADEVAALRGGPPVDWSARERAVVALADALAGGAAGAPAAIDDAVAAGIPEHEVVELVTCAAATVMLNRFCTAFALPLTAATAARLEEFA